MASLHDPYMIYNDDFLLNQNYPTESGLHVPFGTQQDGEAIADVCNSTVPLQPADSVNPSHRSESTVCRSSGHHDGPSGPQPKLQHSGPTSPPFLSAWERAQGSLSGRGRPSKSWNRPTGRRGSEAEESDSGWGGKKPKLYCPFYLKDPDKHHKCSRLWPWRYLVAHLFRKHRKPAKKTRDKHSRATTDSEASFEEPSGITEEQEQAIRELRRDKRLAIEEAWLELWRIIFPHASYPLPHFLIQQRPQDDTSNLTEADLRLLSSGEFRLWAQSFPGMSSVGQDQREEICKELIRTFNFRRLGQDTRFSHNPQREDGTNQDASSDPPTATQEEPSICPQDLKGLEDVLGDSSSTLSFAPSPDADMDAPLFDSIRRILTADSSYAAEDIISAIKKRSDRKTIVLAPGSGFGPAIIDSLASEAPAGQETTPQGTKKRPTRTTGGSESAANKRQKTCTPSDADGDDDLGGDSGGGGGGGGDGASSRNKRQKPCRRWMCPYGLMYPEITCLSNFKYCGRPGFDQKFQLKNHLENNHSPDADVHPKSPDGILAEYYFSTADWDKLKKWAAQSTDRPRDPQARLKVQTEWYIKGWTILFPQSQYVPDSPFHTSNEELEERCHRVVKAMMDLECKRSQAEIGSSHQETQLFTHLKVQEMLKKALRIGLESLPIAAQHFGECEAAEETDHEPQTGAATTTPEDEDAEPTPDGSKGATPNIEAAAAETVESSTPENTLLIIPKSVTPQPRPSQTAFDAQRIPLKNSSEVLLENDGQYYRISIDFNPIKKDQATGQALKARVEVTAPAIYSVKIGDPEVVEVTSMPWILPDYMQDPLSFENSEFNLGDANGCIVPQHLSEV